VPSYSTKTSSAWALNGTEKNRATINFDILFAPLLNDP
jgi:hypothetical protein